MTDKLIWNKIKSKRIPNNHDQSNGHTMRLMHWEMQRLWKLKEIKKICYKKTNKDEVNNRTQDCRDFCWNFVCKLNHFNEILKSFCSRCRGKCKRSSEPVRLTWYWNFFIFLTFFFLIFRSSGCRVRILQIIDILNNEFNKFFKFPAPLLQDRW